MSRYDIHCNQNVAFFKKKQSISNLPKASTCACMRWHYISSGGVRSTSGTVRRSGEAEPLLPFLLSRDIAAADRPLAWDAVEGPSDAEDSSGVNNNRSLPGTTTLSDVLLPSEGGNRGGGHYQRRHCCHRLVAAASSFFHRQGPR